MTGIIRKGHPDQFPLIRFWPVDEVNSHLLWVLNPYFQDILTIQIIFHLEYKVEALFSS